MEHVGPNFPTTAVRKTATASAENGAGDRMSVVAGTFHVPFIVAVLRWRGVPGDFFARTTRVFATRWTAAGRPAVNVDSCCRVS